MPALDFPCLDAYDLPENPGLGFQLKSLIARGGPLQ